MTPEQRRHLQQVRRLVHRAQRRLWWQASLVRLTTWLPLPLLATALWLGAVRMALWPARWDPAALAFLGAVAGAVLLGAGAHRHPRLLAAGRLDRAGATHDALATALWLEQTARADGWAQVQSARAAQCAQGVNLTVALPWPRPFWLGPALAALLLGLAIELPLPAALAGRGLEASSLDVRLPPAPAPFASARDALGEDEAQLLSADLNLLDEVAPQVDDEATRKWLQEIRKVVQEVQLGRIDKRQALETLAALEASRPADSGAEPQPAEEGSAQAEDPDESQRQRDVAARKAMLDAAGEALSEAPDGEAKEELKKAIEQGDLGLLAKVLEKVAERGVSEKDLEKWRKTIEKFADALKDAKAPEKMKELARKISRLEQQRAAQGGLGPEQQRRLQQARHELDQLRKDNGDVQSAQHQVQRLERQARAAADELRRQEAQAGAGGSKGEGQAGAAQKGAGQGTKQAGREKGGAKGGESGGGEKAGKGGAAQALRRAADELRREDTEQKARQAQRVGQERLRDLRQGLSRGGRQQSGRRQQAQGQDQSDASGDQGEGESEGESEVEGRRGGRSKSAQSSETGEQGEQGEQDSQGEGQASGGRAGKNPGKSARKKSFELGSSGLGGKSRMEMMREGYEQGSAGGAKPGRGAGSNTARGRDPGLQAARTEKLRGRAGDGPDIKKSFLEAAHRGFARQAWQDVYEEYSQVAEEMIDKEGLPAGRKALVRRYFEKIRPR